MLVVRGRQVPHLLPGDVQAESVGADLRHGGPRDEHRPAAQQVSLAQQYRGHPAAACLHDEPQHVPDVAVCRVHVITAEHLVLAGQLVRDGVDGHGRRDGPWAPWRARSTRRSRQHAPGGSVIGPQDIRFPAADGVLVVLITGEVRRLGGIQPLELGLGAAQPDLALGGAGSPGVDEAERDNLPEPLPMRRLHHQMGDRVIAAADDQGPELAAVAVRAANLSLEPEQLCLRHAVLPRCHRQP
ncbi:MAG: hypothetical protein WAV12_30675 [Trebonia sp.]|uniref:hypothetical protein n=1 Tax=Trebonia sp. TaxID=2767075 RepID=UPI003BAFEF03